MIKIINTELTDDEYEFLIESVKNFEVDESPSLVNANSYYRQHIESLEIRLSSFFKKLKTDLKSVVSYDFDFNSGWLNKITNESNKNDDFHSDESDMTLIIYLNDDYIGGEFEYKRLNLINRIIPQKRMCVLIGNGLPHRVLPVTEGERYSLVLFFNYVNKKSKTLI